MDTTPAPAVRTENLTKRYGARLALDEVSATIPSGAIAGLVGPNGAGKTTLMAILLGLVRPTSGAVTVLGKAPGRRHTQDQHLLGALLEAPAFHPASTGHDNLAYLARLGGHARSPIPELLHLVGLEGRGDDRYRTFSLGMKQRLGIAAALLGDPAVVVLDEPTNGVDPVGMRDIRAIIRAIADQGRTVLVSSHLLSELEQVCDWLVVLDRGRMVHQGSPASLPRASDEQVVVRPEHPGDAWRLRELVQRHGFAAEEADGAVSVATLGTDPRTLAAALDRLANGAGVSLAELSARSSDLESRYLELVGGAR